MLVHMDACVAECLMRFADCHWSLNGLLHVLICTLKSNSMFLCIERQIYCDVHQQSKNNDQTQYTITNRTRHSSIHSIAMSNSWLVHAAQGVVLCGKWDCKRHRSLFCIMNNHTKGTCLHIQATWCQDIPKAAMIYTFWRNKKQNNTHFVNTVLYCKSL